MIPTRSAVLFAAALAFVSASIEAAQPKKKNNTGKTWIDPKKAAADDPDFLIQGEYGHSKQWQPWAAQVVALGDRKFDAYLLERGLPGLGWDRSKLRVKMTGGIKDGALNLTNPGRIYRASISDGKIVVWHRGDIIARLPRIERESPTLGAKPPKGATVLFDGSSADAWKNGRVENGLLPNSNITTKETFGSYQLHLEFRTPYKPYARGQGRGNSGVYHQGRYETQVLDAFGLDGKMNETGGIYSIAAPRINMCLPPLRWQTYDVDFKEAEFDKKGKLLKHASMTVQLNGVEIHTKQELPKTTTASPIRKITPAPGPIFIQAHGNPVYYRNIWIVRK
ncbi:MAG: hypothetical protein CMO80_07440 [Verrucomicrobiales bacterium]|nr:hypothetical protein [Verrucomicrobiales bacterium]|tara:strand:+ start:480 stop:1490 length:1011 start_codon:yes stop_codon:yes gene_type:complete